MVSISIAYSVVVIVSMGIALHCFAWGLVIVWRGRVKGCVHFEHSRAAEGFFQVWECGCVMMLVRGRGAEGCCVFKSILFYLGLVEVVSISKRDGRFCYRFWLGLNSKFEGALIL